MKYSSSSKHSAVEPLEARIAPATVVASAHWVTATFGAPLLLHAGDGLSTAGANAGNYLLYVEKGDALVFLTDLNHNGDVEFNEVTGIAAGDGFRLISFVDIHGDIATNLLKTSAVISGVATTRFSLSDSDNNVGNDPLLLGDGRILQNNTIEKVELRSLTSNDFTADQNGDGVIDGSDVLLRKAYTTYSIFGNIYAGKGFGAADGGLIIDSLGATQDSVAGNFGFEVNPTIGSIKTGTAASGGFFSYGGEFKSPVTSNLQPIAGSFVKFAPPRGQAGGDIIGVKASDPTLTFSIDGLFSGNGGIGGRGGNIQNVTMQSDDVGGYQIIAGNGGGGPSGGAGGSIIEFADLSSQTGKVLIQTGTGGLGATGAGGNGGSASFGTFNVYGNVNIQLGNGGDGFTAGGNGASFTKGLFTQPLPGTVDAGNGVGTTHVSVVDGDLLTPGFQAAYQASIGTHSGVDIDGDGNGDFVYTSKTNSQVAVMFGDGFGGFRTVVGADGLTTNDRIYLSGVRNPEAIVVNDFNGDGHPDIAVASHDDGSQGGVAVFLAKYEDTTGDGLSAQEDLNHNGVNDFLLSFADARYSNLPQLDAGDPTTLGFGFFWQSPVQVSALTAGDYNGDGKVELAALVTYYTSKTSDAVTGVTIDLSSPHQVLMFLSPDQVYNSVTGKSELTGQFHADVGDKATVVNNVTVPAVPRQPFIQIPHTGAADTVVLETTALKDSTVVGGVASTHDVIIVGVKDNDLEKTARTYDYSNRAPTALGAVRPPAVAGTYAYGKVDQNRDLSDPGKSDKKDLIDMLLLDFTVADLNHDGKADLGVISSTPAGFLVGVVGDGTGKGTQDSGSDGTAAHPYPNGAGGKGNNDNDNQGVYFGSKGTGAGTNIIAIKSMDADANGFIDDLMVLQGTGTISRLHYQSGPQPTDPETSPAGPGGGTTPTTGAVELLGFNHLIGATTLTEFFTDIFLPVAGNTSNPLYIVGRPPHVGTPVTHIDVLNNINGGAFGTQILLENGLKFGVGDGGNALIGKGGDGGSVGSGSKITATIDTITGLPTTDLVGTVQIDVSGTIRVFGGNGGDGFSTGGKGGGVSGVVLRPLINANNVFLGIAASLTAGDGGRGVSGAGGAGGDLSQNSIYGGISFLAGDGGNGRTGGAGGNVLGNQTAVYDSTANSITAIGGNGGDGIKKGGAGGGVLNFSPIAGTPSVESGLLQYTGGKGGDAVAGPGGNGGGIINSSPKPGDGIQIEILLEGGDGGNGTTGGNGGVINKFISTPASNSKKVRTFSAIGGAGGGGTSGNGGIGGDVIGVNVPTRGATGFPFLTNFGYDRVLGGDGGASSGAKGGRGGNVVDLTSGASDGAYAVVGGAGGNGLTVGGKGGDVLNTDLFMGALTTAKALIVAGAGGDASAFMLNPNDPGSPNQGPNSFGGKIGIGGDGGSIIGFHQFGSIGINVDLISGDGGSTLNFGSINDIKGYGGKGGSIQKVKIEGDIGNAIDPSVPIKSFNNVLRVDALGNSDPETMQEWINNHVRSSAGAPATLDASDGNVGIVVGVGGRSKAVVTDPAGHPTVYVKQPSRNIPNGSLIDIEARNILSAIAGNVNRVAAIQVVKNIRVLGGVIGADKPVIGSVDYQDSNGVAISKPVRDGRLVDGALIAKVILDASGRPTSLPGERIFIL